MQVITYCQKSQKGNLSQQFKTKHPKKYPLPPQTGLPYSKAGTVPTAEGHICLPGGAGDSGEPVGHWTEARSNRRPSLSTPFCDTHGNNAVGKLRFRGSRSDSATEAHVQLQDLRPWVVPTQEPTAEEEETGRPRGGHGKGKEPGQETPARGVLWAAFSFSVRLSAILKNLLGDPLSESMSLCRCLRGAPEASFRSVTCSFVKR